MPPKSRRTDCAAECYGAGAVLPLLCRGSVKLAVLPGQVADLARLGLVVVTGRVVRPSVGVEVPTGTGTVTALGHGVLVDVVLYTISTSPPQTASLGLRTKYGERTEGTSLLGKPAQGNVVGGAHAKDVGARENAAREEEPVVEARDVARAGRVVGHHLGIGALRQGARDSGEENEGSLHLCLFLL